MYKVCRNSKDRFYKPYNNLNYYFVPDKSLKQEMHLIRKTRGCGKWEGNVWFLRWKMS